MKSAIELNDVPELLNVRRASGYNTGIAAEYFVISQLYRLGLEAYMSVGNKKSIDIRVINRNGSLISVDVKAVSGYSSLIVNNVIASVDHFVVAVIYNNKISDISTFPNTYIIPSAEIISLQYTWKAERRLTKGKLIEFKDKWSLITDHGALAHDNGLRT